MNTAPKLQNIMRAIDGALTRLAGRCTPDSIQADDVRELGRLIKSIAALAPPSGEGVELPSAEDWLSGGTSYAVASPEWKAGWNAARNRLRSLTTPQSAPVDAEPIGELISDGQPAMGSGFIHSFASPKKLPAGTKVFTTPPPASQERGDRQRVVHDWCVAAFGDDHAKSIEQRGIRLVEEAIEAGQACGCDPAMVHRLVDHIYSKPAGALFQEMGGVGVTLLALAEAAGQDADAAEQTEIERILSKPLEHFAARNAAKNAAGFNVLASPPSSAAAAKEPEQRCPYCAGLIYSDAGCQNCKVGSVWPKPVAAEQAKPDPCIECGADPGEPCYPNCCTRVAEQAQAVELQEEIQWALNGLPQLAINLRFEGQTSRADTVERIVAILRRLAGGVTVDDAAVRRFVDAVNPLVYDLPPPDIIRAALVAALEAK